MAFKGGLFPFWLALPIVIILDLTDIPVLVTYLTGIGIPVAFIAESTIGNLLDGIAIIVSFLTVGPIALIGAAEFIPVIGDPLPIHTVALVMGKFASGSR